MFGYVVEVDKGFLIKNDCALIGVITIRPMKLLKNQQQQSKEDVALTQKVGKTRIVIEQANGSMKLSTGFFDTKIKIVQIGLANLILRPATCFANSSCPIFRGAERRRR